MPRLCIEQGWSLCLLPLVVSLALARTSSLKSDATYASDWLDLDPCISNECDAASTSCAPMQYQNQQFDWLYASQHVRHVFPSCSYECCAERCQEDAQCTAWQSCAPPAEPAELPPNPPFPDPQDSCLGCYLFNGEFGVDILESHRSRSQHAGLKTVTYSCDCIDGFVPDASSQTRCQTRSPTASPTANATPLQPTPQTTAAPTSPVPTPPPTFYWGGIVGNHMCDLGSHDCDTATTQCVQVDSQDYSCPCLEGFVVDYSDWLDSYSRTPNHCITTHAPTASPTAPTAPTAAPTNVGDTHVPTTTPTAAPTAAPTTVPTSRTIYGPTGEENPGTAVLMQAAGTFPALPHGWYIFRMAGGFSCLAIGAVLMAARAQRRRSGYARLDI
jgi:hypothetical protein